MRKLSWIDLKLYILQLVVSGGGFVEDCHRRVGTKPATELRVCDVLSALLQA